MRKMLATILVLIAAAASPARAKDEVIPPPRLIRAELVAKVAEPHRSPYWTLLESPTFGPDGKLYFVHLFGPPRSPKIARLDLATKTVEGLYWDDVSQLSSIHFSPHNGKIYATDIGSGEVKRFDLQTRTMTTVFSGQIEGRRVHSDDIAFDASGNMYVSDVDGTVAQPTGRVVRLDPDGANPEVLLSSIASGNGIAFSPDYATLWLTEARRAQITATNFADGGKRVLGTTVAIHLQAGGQMADSLAVDSAGNLYQAVVNGQIQVYSPDGQLLAIIRPRTSGPKAPLFLTNLAIKPGTRDGYLVTGGETGGYVYRFTALAAGGAQSN